MRLLTVIFGLLLLAVAVTPLFRSPALETAAACPVAGGAEMSGTGCPYLAGSNDACPVAGGTALSGTGCPYLPGDAAACPYLRERADRVSGGCPYSGTDARLRVEKLGI